VTSLKQCRYSILEPSAIGNGMSAAQTLHSVVELAKYCDTLGYERLWLTEHHNRHDIANCDPAVLAGVIAASTRTIRVGSASARVSNSLPLIIAEQFSSLACLFPNRIDIGMANGPGADRATANLHGWRKDVTDTDFRRAAENVRQYFNGSASSVIAAAAACQAPQFWITGSSPESAALAARAGMGFAFSHHMNANDATIAVNLYRSNFNASEFLPEPEVIVCVAAVVQRSISQARREAMPALIQMFSVERHNPVPFPSLVEAKEARMTMTERQRMSRFFARDLVGDVRTVRARLEEIVRSAKADEVMITTVIRDPAARAESYRLIPELFG
jgi:luciferase family oxidoreductase group 1